MFEGQGCKSCHQSGYRGRIGLFELFESTAEVEEMIVSGRRDADIRSYLAAKRDEAAVADGFQKVLQGLTTVSEIERAIAG